MADPTKCPHCGGGRFEVLDEGFHPGWSWADCKCPDCGAEWRIHDTDFGFWIDGDDDYEEVA